MFEVQSNITLKQIASMSGFSVSTVSKALNDSFEISELTKKKIKELAILYNYVPNNYAVALRSKKSNTIAVLFPKFSSLKYAKILEGVDQVVQDNGLKLTVYQLVHCSINENAVFRIIDGTIDGIIIIANSEYDCPELRKQIRKIKKGKFPISYLFIDDKHYKNESLDFRKLGESLCNSVLGKINSKKMP